MVYTYQKERAFYCKAGFRKIAGHFDVEITGATFEGKAPRLTFGTFRLANVDEITAQQIVRQIPEKAKIGYTLKRISDIKDLSGAGIATLTGAPPTSLHIKKNGRFSATLVLEKSGHFEVEITGAVFEVLKSIFVFHKATQTITGIKADQQAYVNTLTTISFPDEIDGVTVKKIKGSLTGVKENLHVLLYYVTNAKNVFGTNGNGKIQTIHLPRNLETIGAYAFHKCSALPSIKIPDSVTTIEKHAFNNCVNLIDVTLSRNLETIENHAFAYCIDLTTINFPNTSLVTIRQSAFARCIELKRLEMPDSMKTIGLSAFYSSGVQSIKFSNSLAIIENQAFQSCVELRSITLPDSVTIIGKYAFDTCSKLSSITLSQSLTTIGERAFQNCPLTSITLSKHLKILGRNAFHNCITLTALTIPSSVENIGASLFGNITPTAVVTLRGAFPAISVAADAFDKAKQILVPAASLNTYKTANIWKKWAAKMVGY